VKADVMRKAAAGGFTNATDCADYLVKKGLPFRDAYQIAGILVRVCAERNIALEDLSLEEFKKICPLFDQGVYEAISLETCVSERKVYGGPGKASVEAQIAYVQKFIDQSLRRN
jgi:argininosuccinate lyase